MNMTIEQITAAYPNVAKLESQAGRELLAAVVGQMNALAAENAGLKSGVVRIFNYGYQHGHESTVEGNYVDIHRNDISEYHEDIVAEIAEEQTTATDSYLAEVRASGIPEGYVLVPQQIFLDPSDIESICSQCGDGHESGYGDFTDGLLWVGNIQRDDGSIVHGLHISSADYTEEGGITVSEFDDQLRQGAAL